MRIDQIVATAVEHLLGRLLRRALIVLAIGVFALVGLYQFTVAGTLALDAEYGLLNARLIVGSLFLSAAAMTFIFLWATRSKSVIGSPSSHGKPALGAPREMQIAMLVEAVMLGYSLARKGGRSS